MMKDEFTTSESRENPASTVPNGVSRNEKQILTLLQGLRLSQDAWAPKSPWDRHGAHAALWGRPAGSFLVVQDSSSQDQLLCVSVGDRGEPVKEYPILTTGAALHLNASHLAFPDLCQLLHFYTLSRDVLPVCLLVPSWVYTLNNLSAHHVPLLGPKTWLCPSSDPLITSTTPETQGITEKPKTVMCTIQVTAASGAMCFINPLYLQEHGDDWLAHPSASQLNLPIRLRRKSTRRAWVGRGLKQKSSTLAEDNSSSFDHDRGSFEKNPEAPATPGGVVLRRLSGTSKEDPIKRSSVDSIKCPLPQSPHRVSWLEDNKIWLNSSLTSSLLQPPGLELDSLSVSSIEEETEQELSPSPSPRLHLADKMMNRLSAVGQALGGLMSPQRRLSKRVQEMAERKGGAFAEAVRGFVEQTLACGAGPGVTCTEMLQEVRSSLTALKETLFDSPEIQSITDSIGDTPDFELDAVLELAIHKVALKPVYSHLYVCLKTARRDDGTLQRLEANKSTLENRSLEELEGASGAGVPDSSMMEKIQQRWTTMHEAYSPSKKVDTLLKVCKNIYHSMNANAKPGTVFGADDFLPCLTWVLLRSDVATLQVDTDYMMELLDPMLLQGEGGYYLTSLYAALFYITSFRPRLAKRQLSAEAQRSLSQWHRRRTLHCNQSRRSRNRRTIRRHGPADESCKTAEEQNSLNASTESSSLTDVMPTTSYVHEPLQGLDEELEDPKEEEEGQQILSPKPFHITTPKTEGKERADGVSWTEDN
ncbi:ras and Rab interactor 2-like [Carassius auratus]|uniref:Ras and Rab interactor 2-like n=1 Tax=Carassius auratus TaxID=7957 RepID=A0A6P6PEX6_CARAU|nr:ras and Rab interactor 2-like [Carassius auratus]XP_026119227.1 ras and Rab interactor 2-like [Carassius auratus]XP_026119228.1 ras and Rab interactor 2-like [Carassius auratus]XP_026119229.1 ras and Rab interactor 2-like [Carassius auratus]XP_026119230.1 ras and Rab interactor 2-like [Carassius auratus]XP_026119231.1 ras and Rab interactor 2-like [Carassius auratus]XP_026119232.1 ras and Rab interactor 2-like [Carassius auratus]